MSGEWDDREATTPEDRTAGNESGAAGAETAAKLAALRAKAVTAGGEVALAMSVTARYRDQSFGDLRRLVLEPLMRDRVALARPRGQDGEDGPLPPAGGVAIWATVSGEVDARIRRQIESGVFPTQLKPEDWTSGEIVWLLDVIAPTRKAAAGVVASFRRLSGGRKANVHPVVARVVGQEALAAFMGAAAKAASRGGEEAGGEEAAGAAGTAAKANGVEAPKGAENATPERDGDG
jgi:hemolysin-activating ACP:hemolysin acyltransferase